MSPHTDEQTDRHTFAMAFTVVIALAAWLTEADKN